MVAFVKRIKLMSMITALLTIALGVVLIMYPVETTLIAVRIVGGFLLILGGVGAVAGFMADKHNKIFMIGGLIIAFLGVWILVKPDNAAALIPIFMGIVLIIDAITDFRMAFEAKGYESSSWLYQIVIGVVGMIMGVVCICNAFGVIAFAVTIMGAFLIFDGITDFYVIFVTLRAAKRYANAQKTAEAIDVDYQEVISADDDNIDDSISEDEEAADEKAYD